MGLSGGADSVALLRALAARSGELGLVIHAAHLHHGLRGAEADSDLEFARGLAAELGLQFHEARVDAAADARADRKADKSTETIEEAARRLRYGWFRKLLASGEIDAVATAHTLDDQAETVLAKFLRGAWTEGLGGISPVLDFPEGPVLRPLLATKRVEIEAYLRELGQEWREDSSNRHVTFTRNRIRHELLPTLEGWNPRLREHLTHMAELARDEEAWWEPEVAQLAQQMLLPGKPARGGGRSAGGGLAAGVALEVSRLAKLAPALQRRLLRYAVERFGAELDFDATEKLRWLALHGRAGQKLELPQGLHAERTARELQLGAGAGGSEEAGAAEALYRVPIPGEIDAPAFRLWLRVDVSPAEDEKNPDHGSNRRGRTATLRNWRPGDQVRLRHSGGPSKIKEVLTRLRVTGAERNVWPVLEIDGSIAWMRGVELEGEPGLTIKVRFSLSDTGRE